MKIELLIADITELTVDAVVNAANSSLMGGGGVDGAIHRKGGHTIHEECLRIRSKQGGCKTGEAVYTTAGNLPARFVIHTVGPVWNNGRSGEEELLQNCYLNSLKIAEKLKLKSIAFPNISTGVYEYPKILAAQVALNTVRNFSSTAKNIEKVIFVCFEEDNFEIYRELMVE
jgi:O-acetyl-ADP-ribose deacetylase (regulator of RNase III)